MLGKLEKPSHFRGLDRIKTVLDLSAKHKITHFKFMKFLSVMENPP